MPGGLTQEAVTAVLRARLDPSAECTGLHRGAVGNGQETWFVTAATTRASLDLVLRRTAAGGPLEWTDRRDEADVMNRVADHGFPVPRVHWVADDDSELDRPYLVMARADGAPIVTATDRQARANELARWLARLHAAALPVASATADAADAAEATRADIARWRTTFERRRAAPWPLVDALLAGLERDLPTAIGAQPAVLLWGDAGLHNALADDSGITALLDWELAHAGHPIEDLAAAVWMELDGPVDVAAMVAAYAEEAGAAVAPDLLDLFVVLACVTRSIMILGAGGAFATGRVHAPSLAGLALDLPVHNLGRAAALAGWDQVGVPEVPAPPERSGPRPDGAEIDRGIAHHLDRDVLPHVDDRHARRGLRTAVALLATAARRAEADAWARGRESRRAEALASMLGEHGLAPEPAGPAVARVELEDDLAQLRPAVRHLLLEDLADRVALLEPLRELYRPTSAT